MPGQLEWVIFGYTLSMNVLFPALIVPGLAVLAAIAYPFIEAAATGDKREHHLLDRPRNAPTRTGLGVMAITAYGIMWAAAGNDLMATQFDLSINDLTWAFRIGIIVLPPLSFYLTRRICLGLQRKDRELALHGRETGRVVRTEEGEYYEVHEPLDEYERWTLVQHESYAATTPQLTDSRGVEAPDAGKQHRRSRLSNFFFAHQVEPARPRDLHHAHDGDDAAGDGDSSPELEEAGHR
jgi:ubiquinol-cytochrome c reductase cytochrome b subunit